jgi:ATP-dependent DNA helicase DinG
MLEHFNQKEFDSDIVWGENQRDRPENRITLYSVPLDIARKLTEMVYPGIDRCIMTSATLSIADSFSYINARLGLDRLNSERVKNLQFGSPFDYQEQALLLAPVYLPSPKEAGYEDAVAEMIRKILEQQPVGTMVLFTSHKMLRNVHKKLSPFAEKRGIKLLGQSIDGPRSMLLKHFQEDRHSVLLGTSSFWEGIDVPGEALELLVITKIPFDVPTDPVVEARTEEVQKKSGNGFINFSVPEAVVRFKQGFGRLIRSGSDRGVVVLADTRISKSRYGKLFLNSLPLAAEMVQDEEEILIKIKKWFK